MEVFQAIHEFYLQEKFTDLRIVSGSDGSEVLCHSIVVISAIPGAKHLIQNHFVLEEEKLTLIFADIAGITLKETVTDIYSSLVKNEEILQSQIDLWAETLGLPVRNDEEEEKVIRKVMERPRRKRKKVVLWEDFQEVSSIPEDIGFKMSTFSNRRSSLLSRKRRRRYDIGARSDFHFFPRSVQVKEEVCEIDSFAAKYVDTEFQYDDEPEMSEEEERQKILDLVTKRRMDFFTSEFNDELLSVDFQEEFDALDETLPPLYDPSPIKPGEDVFVNLSRFSEAILQSVPINMQMYFQAATAGVYLKNDHSTHFPSIGVLSRPNTDPNSICLVPKAVFTALFAVATRNGENVAQPIALYSDAQPVEVVCENFMTLIKKVAQVSTRTILESNRHQSFERLDKEKHIKRAQLRVKVMEADERENMAEKTRIYHQDQEKKLSPPLASPLPGEEYLLKFRLVNKIREDEIFDYVIVHGDRMSTLKVQTFARTSSSRSENVSKASVLIDAMAAFCRLKSADDLHKVSTFHKMIETHYDRLFEQIALEVIQGNAMHDGEEDDSTNSLDKMKRSKTGLCFQCKETFDLSTKDLRRQFENHKLTHIQCDCDITFSSDTQYRTHLKSVHLLKKKLKCAFASCCQYFSSQRALEKHYHFIHEKSLEDGVGVICAICGQTFVNQHYLKAHHLCYHKEFPCTVCGEIIYGKNAQEKHHRDIHATFDDHLCQHCGKGFKLKKYLQIHIINSHTAKQDKPFPCHLCEKGFNNHMKLTQHLDGVHYKRKPYKCRAEGGICNMAFSAQSTRKRHEKVAHKLDIRLPPGRKSTSRVVQEAAAAAAAAAEAESENVDQMM